MPRVKRGMHHVKRRRNILKKVKGFEGGRKSLLKLAKVAATKAGAYAYRDRRVKKRLARANWQVRINAAVRPLGMSYSVFTGALKKKEIGLDRKVLATIADEFPAVFEKIVAATK